MRSMVEGTARSDVLRRYFPSTNGLRPSVHLPIASQ